MRTLVAACLVAGLVVPGTVSAQWGIAAEIGVARFGGSSRDTAGPRGGPYRHTTVELRLDRGRGFARVALALLYAKTGIAGEQPGLAVVQYDLASLWEVAPQVSFRLARFGAGVDVRLEAGPPVQLWTLDGASPTRVAAQTAAPLAWPLAASPPRPAPPPMSPRSARTAPRTSLPRAGAGRSTICFSSRAPGSRTSAPPACTRSSFRSTSAGYSGAISRSSPCRPRRTTAWRKRTNSGVVTSPSARSSSAPLVALATRGESSATAIRSSASTAPATASIRRPYSSTAPVRPASAASSSASA